MTIEKVFGISDFDFLEYDFSCIVDKVLKSIKN